MSSALTVFINGRKFLLNEENIDPTVMLLQFLRKNGLTGSKLGCGEGGCGACTVMLSRFDTVKGAPIHYSANACLLPVCALDGIAVTTVEGIGSMKEGLHPVQQRISAMHGSQCGFCTPGIVMALYTILRSNPDATPHEIESSLDGNLCRCTGYRPILDAARSLSNNKGGDSAATAAAPSSGGCCKGKGGAGGCPCAAQTLKAEGTDEGSFVYNNSEAAIANSASLKEELASRGMSEPIFPPELTHYEHKEWVVTKHGATWAQPVSLEGLLDIKAKTPEVRIIGGNTEVGIEMKLKAMEYKAFVNPMHVKELLVLEETEHGVTVGAGVTINNLRDFIEALETKSRGDARAYRLRGLTATKHMLAWFASNQIRNVACVGGNVVTASPISDLIPMLVACNSVFRVTSAARGARTIPSSKFFVSYRKVALEPDEILENVFIPFTTPFEFVLPFKQTRRREDDISICSAGIRVLLTPDRDGEGASSSGGAPTWTVKNSTFTFGGLGPTVVNADVSSGVLQGKDWSYASVESVFAPMGKELMLPVTVPGGQAEYRTSLAVSFLYKAYLTVTTELAAYIAGLDETAAAALPPAPTVAPGDMSGTINFLTQDKVYTRGEQGHFDRQGSHLHRPAITPGAAPPAVENNHPVPEGGVGQSLMHRNAAAQVTGATKYVDDMPLPANALHACLVTSARPHARLLSVDTSEAEKCRGFVRYISAKDVTGCNAMGAVVQDEEIFASEIVHCVGAVRFFLRAESSCGGYLCSLYFVIFLLS
jgi:xanthine dehydrogenase/oxidase